MISSSFSYKSSKIHYLKSGRKEEILFFFHGYGESAASFENIAERLSDHFRIIAIDLPFHGKTEWNEGQVVKPEDLLEILDSIAGLESERLSKWTVSGYSMGGRIALMLLQIAPERISHLVLIAPDGLTINWWYWLATQTMTGKQLFRYTMHHPGWFKGLLRLGKSSGLVNPSEFNFSMSYLQDPGIRMDLYQRWIGMKGFRPSVKKIKKLMLREKIHVDIIYGRFDRIISQDTGKEFQKGIENHVRVVLLDVGHQLLHAKTMDAIVRVFINRSDLF